MESLIEALQRLSKDAPAAEAMIRQSSQTRAVPKGTILQRAGAPSAKAFFVRQGCLRSYTIDAKGKEHIFMFGPEGWTVGDLMNRVSGGPTQLWVDAIEDSVVDELAPDLMNNILELLPALTSFAVPVFEKRISVLQKRVMMLMSASAAERYQDFCETYPSIVQRVPQKMVASYLGITPEALSKIRGEIAKGKK